MLSGRNIAVKKKRRSRATREGVIRVTLKNGGIEESTTKEIEAINIRETIATNIVAYRKKLKLSRAELSKKVGVTEAAVSQYERGLRTPQVEILCRMANTFKTSVDVLLGSSLENYAAVKDYRFERAADFVFGFNLFVFETPEGIIRVYSQQDEKNNQSLYSKDGLVSVKKDSKKNRSIIEFEDRDSFIFFVEQFQHFIFEGSSAIATSFKEYIEVTARGGNFIPTFLMKYMGNEGTPF